jgi:Fic family protein
VRAGDTWEEWVLYMLTAVEDTAIQAVATIHAIRAALMDYKHRIRDRFKFYSQDLINNLFTHPYTKIEFVQRDLGVTRLTATRYLEALASAELLHKRKIGRTNYFINPVLTAILTGEPQERQST